MIARGPAAEPARPPAQRTASGSRQSLIDAYLDVRRQTMDLRRPLSAEDCQVQSMPDASPAKWHLAHVTWFFEEFILRQLAPGYAPLDERFRFLFNSYYNAVGPRHERPKRGLLSRPSLADVERYREHVDAAMTGLMRDADEEEFDRLRPLVELGLNHEQQHQELILTDVKHALWSNPLRPAYADAPSAPGGTPPPIRWRRFDAGIYEVGHAGNGFAYDNESPRHLAYLHAFEIASRPVSCGEFLAFMGAGGYDNPRWWLDEGWGTVQREGWRAPLYWERSDGRWQHFTLSGTRGVDPAEPVCHLSFFEADAYARWSGARLPTEFEWEIAFRDEPVEGTLLESGRFHPATLSATRSFGDVWQWTSSPYLPYPGYRPAEGALGEYNAKFMCNQYVLRGGSCATPRSHLRATYRNFFPLPARWQFTGLRLARDAP